MKLNKMFSIFLTLFFIISLIPVRQTHAEGTQPQTVVQKYEVTNSDFSSELSPVYGLSDAAKAYREKTITLEAGGAAMWVPLPVNGAGGNPSVGDTVYAEVDAYIDPGIPADRVNTLLRLNGGSILSEVRNLGSSPRGKLCTVSSEFINNSGVIPSGTDNLWIELHNDNGEGNIEVAGIRVWGVKADGTRVDYSIPGGSITNALATGTTWGFNSKVKAQTALIMKAGGTAVWRSIDIGSGQTSPHIGDKVSANINAYVCTDVTSSTSLMILNNGIGAQLCGNNTSTLVKGKWGSLATSAISNGGVIGNGVNQLWVELHNDSDGTLRIKNYEVYGERPDFNPAYDINADGKLDPADLQRLTDEFCGGSGNLAYDFDGDGEFTTKDISFFKKFALKDASEFYLNLDHFNFLNQDVTIDGKNMAITRLYSEPVDRNDPSKGYQYVGDPQEGIACLDDTARAVVAYAEHHTLYHDRFSLDKIKRLLEFVMWMQEDDGDFRNFIAQDASGNFYKKDSNSSFKAFSYWACRGYTAICYGYSVWKDKDTVFAARLKERMELCNTRIHQKIDGLYGTYKTVAGKEYPAWNLENDTWLTSIALSALCKNYELLPDESIKTNIKMLGEALSASSSGGFREYPLGGLMHLYGNRNDVWDEWGSTQAAALAWAGKEAGEPQWISAAELAADSFLSDLLISGRAFGLSPNKIKFPQINYASASYVDNYIKLYEVTGKEKYAAAAGLAGTWWTGNNAGSAHMPMFNQQYGLAYDGIVFADTVNTNSGAESVDEAVRALARILKYPVSAKYLTAGKTSEAKAVTVELEEKYTGLPDTELALGNGGLNDVNRAKVAKPATDASLDESVLHTQEEVIPAESRNTEAEIYTGWYGRNAFYCSGTGYNNIRLYNDSYLYAEIPVGPAENLPHAGDYIKLDFMLLMQFNTYIRSEVYAVDTLGTETLIADDSSMKYNARTWYSGSNSVKTKPICKVPEGTVKLKVKFSVTANNAAYNKGYATLTQAKLFRMNSPEVMAGGSNYSGNTYVEMPAGTEKTFDVSVSESGRYDVFISAGNTGKPEPANLELTFNGNVDTRLITEISDNPYTDVQIVKAGSLLLNTGTNSLKIRNDGSFAANVDAIILYPVQTYAVYTAVNGDSVKMLRDSEGGMLVVGSPAEVDGRDRILLSSEKAEYRVGKKIAVSGRVVHVADSSGIANIPVQLCIGETRVTAVTNENGLFEAILPVAGVSPGRACIEAATDHGEGRLYVNLLPAAGSDTGSGTTAKGRGISREQGRGYPGGHDGYRGKGVERNRKNGR